MSTSLINIQKMVNTSYSKGTFLTKQSCRRQDRSRHLGCLKKHVNYIRGPTVSLDGSSERERVLGVTSVLGRHSTGPESNRT